LSNRRGVSLPLREWLSGLRGDQRSVGSGRVGVCDMAGRHAGMGSAGRPAFEALSAACARQLGAAERRVSR
jgi:hypothetical protein